jgi:hypothetical protein
MGIFKSLLGHRILDRWKLAIIGLFFSQIVCAWNAVGHRVIAQIAYDHLTLHAKHRFNSYNRLLNYRHGDRQRQYNFVEAAVWLDKIRYSSDLPGEIHYIDLPFSREKNRRLPQIPKLNVVSALSQAQLTLKDESSRLRQRAVAFRVLSHLTGDLHQPLHAITYVSATYPQGDKGGNLIRLPENPVAKTLHAYWDQGAGALPSMNRKQVRQYAALLESRWPCMPEDNVDDFFVWAQASHQIAEKQVYSCLKADEHVQLDAEYQRRAMMISESQLALAGCRLARLLNEIDAATTTRPAKTSSM